MNRETIKRLCAGLLIGAAFAPVLLSQTNARATAGQGDGNPFVAALEKQIAGQENKPATNMPGPN